jgi:hypothetical protein
MDNSSLIPVVFIAAVLLVAVVIAWFISRGRRSQDLRNKYGPEYDYTVEQAGDRRAAEQALLERERRVNQLAIRDLGPQETDQYHARWVEIQADFVDKPAEMVEKADALIQEVMSARGFPTADFEQRAADISVFYPEFVPNYRNAHAIAMKSQRNEASTEDLRQAMVYYRSLFEELLGTETTKYKEVKIS